jgi:hypothetical protein
VTGLLRLPAQSVLPAWFLVVRADVEEERRGEPLVLSHRDVHAEIAATLRGGLQPGEITITLEGLGDDAHAKLRTATDTPGGAALDLYLAWLGIGGVGGYLANLVGMTDLLGPSEPPAEHRVARLAISKLRRQRGARDYETVIEAVDVAVHRLSRRPYCPERGQTTLLGAAGSLANDCDVPVRYWADGRRADANTVLATGQRADDETAESPQVARGRLHLQAFTALQQAMSEATNLGAPGMFLVRDGVLHAGVRPIPLEGDPIEVSADTGLVETTIERGAGLATDETDLCEETPGRAPDTVTLVCLGRPDVRPGDVVTFPAPAGEAPTTAGSAVPLFGNLAELPLTPQLGGLGDAPLHAYVETVAHRLGRTSGFVTTITATHIDPEEPWQQLPPRPTDATDADEAEDRGRDPLGRAVRRMANSVQRNLRPPDVAEVRAAHPADDGPASPAQTVRVWRGLAASDSVANQARRLPIDRTHGSQLEGVATATPFAWDRCGLIVPRYPFTRVLLAHRNGRGEDAVDVGALWGPGGRPEQAHAGDWWLHLPAAVPEDERTSVGDDAEASGYDGAVTNDLIDADGRRVIEVGELTIRVNVDTDSNEPAAGTRPTPPGDEALTIEHTRAGSRIVMDKDGNVRIEAAGNLDLTAGGTLTIAADQVDVEVGNTMDVRRA